MISAMEPARRRAHPHMRLREVSKDYDLSI
jgi:hypothetical protein